MSNEMNIIIASPEARTEVGMSRILNNVNLKEDRNSLLNCRGALRYGMETNRYTQTNKHHPRIYNTNPDQVPPRKLIDKIRSLVNHIKCYISHSIRTLRRLFDTVNSETLLSLLTKHNPVLPCQAVIFGPACMPVLLHSSSTQAK